MATKIKNIKLNRIYEVADKTAKGLLKDNSKNFVAVEPVGKPESNEKSVRLSKREEVLNG